MVPFFSCISSFHVYAFIPGTSAASPHAEDLFMSSIFFPQQRLNFLSHIVVVKKQSQQLYDDLMERTWMQLINDCKVIDVNSCP